MITLFTRPQSSPRRGSAAIAVSILAHVAGCGWLFFGLAHTPRFDRKSTLQRFTVRVLDAPEAQPQLQPPAAGAHPPSQAANRVPTPAADTPVSPPSVATGDESPAPAPSPASQLAKLVHQSQILVQPDAPPDVVLLHKTPIPTVFLWAPASAPIKPIIEAPQQKSMVAQLRPKLDPPNREVNLADVRMSSTPFAAALHALPPSTTSPIVVRGPDPVKQMPQTATQPAAEPTPVRVMSISDLQAQGGPVAIPLANASAKPSATPSLSPGHSDASTESAHPGTAGKQPGAAAGTTPGTPAPSAAAPGQNSPSPGQNSGTQPGKAATGNSAVAPAGAAPAPGPGSDAGAALANLGPVTHITLPKDGQFGVVVVGSSLAEQFPETVGIWNGRMVYTVYLHVGAGKNWILQYSLPSAAQAAAMGSTTRPDAPWPYDIVRPHFDPDDFNSDALMVHGFVNAAGRFERLALVFPEEFAKAKFLLSALQQWEFRPARQNGQVAAVEVLLIIPEETE